MNEAVKEIFEPFLESGTIASVGPLMKSGKEAEVWRCHPGMALAERAAEIGQEAPAAVDRGHRPWHRLRATILMLTFI
jgi:hypothetical protein